MFPKEIIEILEKYEDNDTAITKKINLSISEIVNCLYSLNDRIIKKMTILAADKNTNNNIEEVIKDTIVLRNYAQSLTCIDINEKINDENTTSRPSIQFDDFVCIHICAEDVCPKCASQLNATTLYFSRTKNEDIIRDSIKGYKCTTCGSLYITDSEVSTFNFSDTNVRLSTKFYHKMNIQDVVYVITDVNKCSANNHDLKDVIGTFPYIDKNGKTKYSYVDLCYCKTCSRYVMLKDSYENLPFSPVCQIIDETKVKTNTNTNTNTNNSYEYDEDKIGSKLSQHGYNVNCVDNLTQQQREVLLSSLIIAKILTKEEIVGNIDKNIANGNNRIGTKKEWTNAIEKWEHDKEFVKSFKIEQSHNDINIEKIILKYVRQF